MTRTIANKVAAPIHHWIKLAAAGVLAATLVAMSSTASFAQTPPPLDQVLVVPTTKLLAIGSFTAKATPSVSKSILPSEVRETVRLYLAGKIDQWYVKQDQSGVMSLMNVTDPKEAHELLDKLPLGQAGLMEFQFIALGPISPLRLLFDRTREVIRRLSTKPAIGDIKCLTSRIRVCMPRYCPRSPPSSARRPRSWRSAR
jgi:hypothetical protein